MKKRHLRIVKPDEKIKEKKKNTVGISLIISDEAISELLKVNESNSLSDTIKEALKLYYAVKSLQKDGFTEVRLENNKGYKKEIII